MINREKLSLTINKKLIDTLKKEAKDKNLSLSRHVENKLLGIS